MGMKISGPGGVRGTTGPERKKKTSGSGDGGAFADNLRDASESGEAGETAGTYGPQSVAAMDGVLAVQEVGDSTEERARSQVRRRGEDLLDRLERIRIQLLSGRLSKDELAQLAHALREKRPQVKDPNLIEIMDEIELRAEVEIAKLTRTI